MRGFSERFCLVTAMRTTATTMTITRINAKIMGSENKSDPVVNAFVGAAVTGGAVGVVVGGIGVATGVKIHH